MIDVVVVRRRWVFSSPVLTMFAPLLSWLLDHPLFTQGQMETSMAKSQFLRLVYQMQVGGSVDRDHLEAMETEVCHLHEELEAS